MVQIKKLILIFGFLALQLIVPNSYAENITNVTHDGISLIVPEIFNLTYMFNFTNHTWPINCSYNATNISTERCEVDRTMGHGETYFRDDLFCALDIKCPECQCEKWENRSYFFHFRIYSPANDSDVYIVNLDTNETKDYPMSQDFSFEDEIEYFCPALEQCEDNEIVPLNISDGQFASYCLRPLIDYGDSLTGINQYYLDQMEKSDIELGTLRQSNLDLSEKNAKLQEQLTQFDETKNTKNALEADLRDSNNKLIECNEDLSKEKTGNGLMTFFFWFMFAIIILGGMAFGMFYTFKKIAVVEEGN